MSQAIFALPLPNEIKQRARVALNGVPSPIWMSPMKAIAVPDDRKQLHFDVLYRACVKRNGIPSTCMPHGSVQNLHLRLRKQTTCYHTMHKTTAFQNQGILHRLRQRKRHRQRAMKLRELQSYLEGVTDFQEPKAELEQYVTPPHLAAQIVHIMGCDFDDVEGKRLCDLGCGTGMLTIAVAVAGAQHVTGMDIDADAIEIAQQSAVDYDCENIVDFVRADLSANVVHSQKLFDTVVMNPPFGTKRKGVDILFLCTALNLARSSVYSMHKTSTRSFIEKKFRKFGVDGKVLAKMRFNIGRTYAFQKKNAVDVEVDLWHFDVQNASVIPASDTLINVDRPLEFIGTNGTGVYNVQDRKMQKKRRGKQR